MRSALRTSWQVNRKQTVLSSTSNTATVALVQVGVWVGARVPASSVLLLGSGVVPAVGIDAYAILPISAMNQIAEGDQFVDLERWLTGTNPGYWQAVAIKPFESKVIVELKSIQSPSGGN